MRDKRQFATFTGFVVALAAAGAQAMQVEARPSTQGVAPPMHPAMGGGFESGFDYYEEPERDQSGSGAHSRRSTNRAHMNETHTADNEKTNEGIEGDGQEYENTRESARPDYGAHESNTTPAGGREMLPPPDIDRRNDYHIIMPGDGTQEAWAARTINASGILPRRATAQGAKRPPVCRKSPLGKQIPTRRVKSHTMVDNFHTARGFPHAKRGPARRASQSHLPSWIPPTKWTWPAWQPSHTKVGYQANLPSGFPHGVWAVDPPAERAP